MKRYIEQNSHGDYGGQKMNNNAETFINDWVIEEWNKTDKFLVCSVHDGDIIKVSRKLWGTHSTFNHNIEK